MSRYQESYSPNPTGRNNALVDTGNNMISSQRKGSANQIFKDPPEIQQTKGVLTRSIKQGFVADNSFSNPGYGQASLNAPQFGMGDRPSANVQQSGVRPIGISNTMYSGNIDLYPAEQSQIKQLNYSTKNDYNLYSNTPPLETNFSTNKNPIIEQKYENRYSQNYLPEGSVRNPVMENKFSVSPPIQSVNYRPTTDLMQDPQTKMSYAKPTDTNLNFQPVKSETKFSITPPQMNTLAYTQPVNMNTGYIAMPPPLVNTTYQTSSPPINYQTNYKPAATNYSTSYNYGFSNSKPKFEDVKETEPEPTYEAACQIF